jgi:16S rRNA G966 N2-methylase RsmD
MGTLYYGDNLEILHHYLKDETVDLVYLDPPFNPAQNYNAFFQEKDGTAAASAGFYEHKMNRQKYPRLQLRTVKELMDGKNIERPSNVAALDETFKKAPKAKVKETEQAGLDL